MELAIHWSQKNIQSILALLDIGADCSQIFGNPERFPWPAAYTDGYGGKTIKKKAETVPLGGCLGTPTKYMCPQSRIHSRGGRFARPALTDISRGVLPEGVAPTEVGECQATLPTGRPCRDWCYYSEIRKGTRI